MRVRRSRERKREGEREGGESLTTLRDVCVFCVEMAAALFAYFFMKSALMNCW